MKTVRFPCVYADIFISVTSNRWQLVAGRDPPFYIYSYKHPEFQSSHKSLQRYRIHPCLRQLRLSKLCHPRHRSGEPLSASPDSPPSLGLLVLVLPESPEASFLVQGSSNIYLFLPVVTCVVQSKPSFLTAAAPTGCFHLWLLTSLTPGSSQSAFHEYACLHDHPASGPTGTFQASPVTRA